MAHDAILDDDSFARYEQSVEESQHGQYVIVKIAAVINDQQRPGKGPEDASGQDMSECLRSAFQEANPPIGEVAIGLMSTETTIGAATPAADSMSANHSALPPCFVPISTTLLGCSVESSCR